LEKIWRSKFFLRRRGRGLGPGGRAKLSFGLSTRGEASASPFFGHDSGEPRARKFMGAQGHAKINRRLRRAGGRVVGLLGWALNGAAELARIASSGDSAAVVRRVDLPSLRHSLGSQNRPRLPQAKSKIAEPRTIARGFAGGVGVSVADAMLREVLTPENIASLLREGRLDKGGGSSGEALWKAPRLEEAFRSGLLQAALNTYFDGPVDFVVILDGGAGRYGAHLRLSAANGCCRAWIFRRRWRINWPARSAAKQNS